VGTAAYLSPELARGDEPTPAADVYALGVVVYQLLTARLPWEGTTLAELAMRRENETPLPPTSYDSSVPETLSKAVLTALAGDPEARYSTARSLSRALRAGVAGTNPPPPDASEAPTRAIGGDSSPTRVLGTPEPVTPTVRSEPPPVRPRRAAAPRSAAPARPSSGRRFARFLAFVVLVLVLAAVIAAVVIALTDSASKTDVAEFLRNNVKDQVDTVIQFIKDHTGG
jgi:serine/threonine-protein kinase